MEPSPCPLKQCGGSEEVTRQLPVVLSINGYIYPLCSSAACCLRSLHAYFNPAHSCGLAVVHLAATRPSSNRSANSGRPLAEDHRPREGRPDWLAALGQPTWKLGPPFVWTPGNWKSVSAKCFCIEKEELCFETRTTTCDPSTTVRIEHIAHHCWTLSLCNGSRVLTHLPLFWQIKSLYIHTYRYTYIGVNDPISVFIFPMSSYLSPPSNI